MHFLNIIPRHKIALISGILLLTVLAYLPGLNGGYYLDDQHVVENNPHIRITTLDIFPLTQAVQSHVVGGRELSMLTFALNHYFFGHSAWWYKFINLMIHLVNGLGIYWLTCQLIRLVGGRSLPHADPQIAPQIASPIDATFTPFLPFIMTALWLLHPINLIPVLYISQRMTSLAAMFMLYGLLAYLWIRLNVASSYKRNLSIPLVLAAFAYLGYECKENGVLLFGYAFIVEVFILRFRTNDKWDKGITAIFTAMFVAAFSLIAYKFYTTPGWIVNNYGGRFYSMEERVLTQFRVLLFYIIHTIAPSNSALTLWHDGFALSKHLFAPITTLISALFLLAAAYASWALRKIAPLMCLGIAWFFVSHSIESTVIALEIMHEHRNYLASFGVVTVIISGLVLAAAKLPKRINAAGLCLIVSVCLGLGYVYVLHERSKIWGDTVAHTIHEAENQPESAVANSNAARVHFFNARDPKRYDVAEETRKGMQFAQAAARADRHSIVPEMLMIFASAELSGVEYDSKWLASATRKLQKYPYIAPSQLALRNFVHCLKAKLCVLPPAEVEALIAVAYSIHNSILLTSVGEYYVYVNPNPEKAENALHRGTHHGSPHAQMTYIYFLIYAKQLEKACAHFDLVQKQIDQQVYPNISLFADHLKTIESKLGGCA